MKKVAAVVLLAVLAGCSGKKGTDLLETATFEEKQGNRPHAIQLYEKILKEYPGTEAAKKAEERLVEIRKQ